MKNTIRFISAFIMAFGLSVLSLNASAACAPQTGTDQATGDWVYSPIEH